MDEAMLKSGQFPNVAIEAGTDPAEVMRQQAEDAMTGAELEDMKAHCGGAIEWCMEHGDSLGEALLHADEICRAERADTREQLEADVERMVKEHSLYWLRTYIIEWLDRQSTITERELCGRCSPYATAKDYLDTIDSLTAERDHFRKHVNHLMALIADIARKQPYTFDPEAPYMTLDTIGDYLDELQDRVDSLTAERDQLSRDLEAEHAMVVQFEYDNEVLKTKLDIAEFQRDELGEKNSRQRMQLSELQDAIRERNEGVLKRQWQYRVEKLTAERDKLLAKVNELNANWRKANDGWAEANAEAERWRQKCEQLNIKLKIEVTR